MISVVGARHPALDRSDVRTNVVPSTEVALGGIAHPGEGEGDMSTALVYLHGIGHGDREASWAAGLNKGLAGRGYPQIEPDGDGVDGGVRVVRPRYSALCPRRRARRRRCR